MGKDMIIKIKHPKKSNRKRISYLSSPEKKKEYKEMKIKKGEIRRISIEEYLNSQK